MDTYFNSNFNSNFNHRGFPMNIRQYTLPALIAAALFSSAAQAETVTGSLPVTLKIDGNCTVGTSGNVDFGTRITTNVAGITTTGTINVTCTATLPYEIRLDAGQGAGATMLVRKMTNTTSGNNETLNYDLRHTSPTDGIWGDGSPGTDSVTSAGDGLSQAHTVYANIPQQVTPPNGDYSDTVGITVIW